MKSTALRDAHALRIRARRDVTSSLAGSYASAFRGRGLIFEELRDYVPGDDLRWIEWNATARQGRPIVKTMREERDLMIALLVDVSSSLEFGFGEETKAQAARRVASAIATAAIRNHDRVALATFSDDVHETVMPGNGTAQLERVFQALARKHDSKHTAAENALRWAYQKLPHHSIVLLVSDFLFEPSSPTFRRCARKHEFIALRITDQADRLPAGQPPVRVQTLEGGRNRLMRASAVRSPEKMQHKAQQLLALGAEVADIENGPHLVASLRRFFANRSGVRA